MKNEHREGGPFVSFILLNSVAFDMEKLLSDLKNDWGIDVADDDLTWENDTVVCTIDGMTATVSLMPAPVPNEEAVENARTNFRWPEAVSVAEAHRAHLLVAVLPQGQSLAQAGIVMVKLGSSCLKQKNATAINTLGSVLAPDFYIDFAEGYLNNSLFPIMNLVFFGLYSRDKGKTVCAYTYGMHCFCKDEIEILDSPHPAQEVMELLTGIASYVIEEDVLLQDGETIGFSEEQKLPIQKSEGQALDGKTLKIGF
ncbi:DUF4261 domain-containing protein [Anaeromassilibacillus senegalensis]|uniref:DUF4261 domain-containing protein n=1 Tax=Anaeromassilibacillus senegalensis TaxID=1673717 RepID=UPI000682B56C|nr:DUF4261 domain-containing protein [Anaeromassilibacillus senegalensis]